MSKRNSIYEKRLQMLLAEFNPLDGLSGLNIRLRKFGRCLNVVEINDVFDELKKQLEKDEIVMDECLDYEEWSDDEKWRFRPECSRYDDEDGNVVKKLVNRMQNFKGSDNNKIAKDEIRDKIQTNISILASQKFLSDDELDEICYEGIRELQKKLREINEITLYKTWTNEAYINLSRKYKALSDKKIFSLQFLRKDFQNWKNRKLDIELDDLIDYRGGLIVRLLKCDFCACCDKDFKIKDTDKLKYLEEIEHCSVLKNMDEQLLKRYAYLRRIFTFDSRLYRMVNEEKLGKHIYMNRMNLTDDEIYEFFQLTEIINLIQKEMVFENVRPDDGDREKLLWYNLRQAGIIDYNNQPIKLSLEEKGLLAKEIANALQIQNIWVYAAKIWNEDKESLRKAFVRKMEKDEADVLMNKFQKAIGLD